MTMLDPDDRYHIETRLGRALTDEELAEARTFDELGREQLAIVAQLAHRGILASAYVRAVVPSAGHSDVRDFVMSIQDFVARKYPPEQLAMEHLYGRELGRPLTDEERRLVASLPDLGEAQVGVARQLASRERVLGLLYLADVVKSAATQERDAYVDSLLRDGDP
jgi:hypothetical protein